MNSCEIINLESSATTCKNPPNFPATVYGAIGGLRFKENPIICGGTQNGSHSNKCYSLENNEWVSYVSMNSVRAKAAAAQLQDGKLLVTGGYVGNFDLDALNSAEMLTEEGWDSKIPSLPVTIYGHCMVTVNSTTVMVIGGYQNVQYSGKTFVFTSVKESWIEGPELKYKRSWHSCGKIRRNKESQEMSIIVAGGYDEPSYLSSVEILEEGANDWQAGPDLPLAIGSFQMVQDQNGGAVVIGLSSSKVSLYQLPHGGQDAVWTKMEQKLKTGRYIHTTILIPDNIVDCT
jgi:hypothetical protein